MLSIKADSSPVGFNDKTLNLPWDEDFKEIPNWISAVSFQKEKLVRTGREEDEVEGEATIKGIGCCRRPVKRWFRFDD